MLLSWPSWNEFRIARINNLDELSAVDLHWSAGTASSLRLTFLPNNTNTLTMANKDYSCDLTVGELSYCS